MEFFGRVCRYLSKWSIAAISALYQMQHPNLRGPLLVNESNYNAALLRACICAGRLGIEFRPLSLPDTVTQAWIQEQLSLVWLPLLTGSLLMGVCAGLLGLWVFGLVAMAK